MTEERAAHILALVEKCFGAEEGWGRVRLYNEIEAALRDAPQAEGWVMVPVEPTAEMIQAAGSRWVDNRNVYRAMLAATPSAPTAGPDERAMASELIKVAAWLLSPKPTRQIDRLEDQTHIGHRQFESAQEAMRETLRLKAIEIKDFADAARALKGTP